MLDPHHLLQALLERREEFVSHQHRAIREQTRVQEQWSRLCEMSPGAIETVLAQESWPGARLTREFQEHPGGVVPFAARFAHHEAARQWARDILAGHVTCAVDGSQLMPDKELSLPVAVVQTGWFLNPHQADRPFEKRVQTEVLGPEELLSSGSEEKLFHEQSISLKRYRMETQRLQTFCREYAQASSVVLGLFDGSFVVSFAEVLKDVHRREYLAASLALLRSSQEHRVPLVGYIDTSAARDILRMVSVVFDQDETALAHGFRDIHGWDEWLPHWGDRSVAFVLARPGILRDYQDMSHRIGFCYLRTSMQKPPVRIEFPLWLLEQNLLEPVLDLLRAEVIIGNGYPYALETADQVAWFAPQDRAKFTRILHQFLRREDVALSVSSKLQSKQRRRTTERTKL